MTSYYIKKSCVRHVVLIAFFFAQLISTGTTHASGENILGQPTNKRSAGLFSKEPSTGNLQKHINPSVPGEHFEQSYSADHQPWANHYEEYSYQPITKEAPASSKPGLTGSYPSSFPPEAQIEFFNDMLKTLSESLQGITGRSAFFNSIDADALSENIDSMGNTRSGMVEDINRMYEDIDQKNAELKEMIDAINAMEQVGEEQAARFNTTTDALAADVRSMAGTIDSMTAELRKMPANIDKIIESIDQAKSHESEFDKDMDALDQYVQSCVDTFKDVLAMLKQEERTIISDSQDVVDFFKEVRKNQKDLRDYKTEYAKYLDALKQVLTELKADLAQDIQALEETKAYLNEVADYYASVKVQPDQDQEEASPVNEADALCQSKDEKYFTLETCRENCKLRTCMFRTNVGGAQCYECPSGGHEQCADKGMLPADVSWCKPGGICYDLAEFVCSGPMSVMTKELIPIQCTTCKARPDECGAKVDPTSSMFTQCNASCDTYCEYAGSYTVPEWDGKNEDIHCYKCHRLPPPSTCEDLKWGFTDQKVCTDYCMQTYGPDASCSLQNFQMKSEDEMNERRRRERNKNEPQKPGPGQGPGGGAPASDKPDAGKPADGQPTEAGEKDKPKPEGEKPKPPTDGPASGSGGGPSQTADQGKAPAGGETEKPTVAGPGKDEGKTRVTESNPPAQPEKPKTPAPSSVSNPPAAPAGTAAKAPEVKTEAKGTSVPKDPCAGKDYKGMFKYEKDDSYEKMNFRNKFIDEYNKGPNNFLDFKETMLNNKSTPTQQRVWFEEFNRKIVDAASDPCSGFVYPQRQTGPTQTKDDPCKGKERKSIATYGANESAEEKAFRDRYVSALRSGKFDAFHNDVINGPNDNEVKWLAKLDKEVDTLVKDPCSDVKRVTPPTSPAAPGSSQGEGTSATKEKDPCADKKHFSKPADDEAPGKMRLRHNFIQSLQTSPKAHNAFTSGIFSGSSEQDVTWLKELYEEFKTFSEDPCFGGKPQPKTEQPQQPGTTTEGKKDTPAGTQAPVTGGDKTQASTNQATDQTTAPSTSTQVKDPCEGKRDFNVAPAGEDPRKTEIRMKLFEAANNYKTLRERSDNLANFRKEIMKGGTAPQSDIDFLHELFGEYQAMLNDPCFNQTLATRERPQEEVPAGPDPCQDEHVKDLSTAAEGEREAKTNIRNQYVTALKQGTEAVRTLEQSIRNEGNPFHTNWLEEIRDEYHRLINTPCYKDGKDLGRPGSETQEKKKEPKLTPFQQLTDGLGTPVETKTQTSADNTNVTHVYKNGSTLETLTTGSGTKYHTLKHKDGTVLGTVTEYTDGSTKATKPAFDGSTVTTEIDKAGKEKITYPGGATQETTYREDGSRKVVTIDKYGYRTTTEYKADGGTISSTRDTIYKKEPGQEQFELHADHDEGETWGTLSKEMKAVYTQTEQRRLERERQAAERERLRQELETQRRLQDEQRQRFGTVNRWLTDLILESITLEQAEAERLSRIARLKKDIVQEHKTTMKELVRLREEALYRKDTRTAYLIDQEIIETAEFYEPYLKMTDEQKYLDEKQETRWRIGSEANSFARTVQSWAVGDYKRLYATEENVTKVTKWLLSGSEVQQKTLRERFMSNSEAAYLSARVDWLESKLKDPHLTRVEREVINEMLEINTIGLSGANAHIRSMHVLIATGYVVDIGMTVLGGKIIGGAVKGATYVAGKFASTATMQTLQTPVRTIASNLLARATTAPTARIFSRPAGSAMLRYAQRYLDPRNTLTSKTVRAAHYVGTTRGAQLAADLFKVVFVAPIRPSLLWRSQSVVYAGVNATARAETVAAQQGMGMYESWKYVRSERIAAETAAQESLDLARAYVSRTRSVRLAEQARRQAIRESAQLAEEGLRTGLNAADNVASTVPSRPGTFDPAKTQAFDNVLRPPERPVFDPTKTQEFGTVLQTPKRPPTSVEPTGDYSFDLTTPKGRAAFEKFQDSMMDYTLKYRDYYGTTKTDQTFDILRDALEIQPWYKNLPTKGKPPATIDPNAGTLIDGTKRFPDTLSPPTRMPPAGFDETATVLNKDPLTSTQAFDQVLPTPHEIPKTVGPSRLDPTKTQAFSEVLPRPTETQMFPEVIPTPKPPVKSTTAPKALTETQILPPRKPTVHDPFTDAPIPLPSKSQLKGQALTDALNRWKSLTAAEKQKIIKETVTALRDAALMGDKWATRALVEIVEGRLKFYFDPRLSAYGIANLDSSVIRLNPFVPDSVVLRSGDNIASTLIHEYAHVYKGGKTWAAQNIPGKANLPTKGNYNENRAHLAEVIFNRNLINARLQKLRSMGVPMTYSNIRRAVDLSKMNELNHALGVKLNKELLEIAAQSGGGLREYDALMRIGDDLTLVKQQALKEGISLEEMFSRIRTREALAVRRTLQKNLVGDMYGYGASYDKNIVEAISNLSLARGGSITRARHMIYSRWKKVLDNPTFENYDAFKKFLQDEFLTTGGPVRKNMTNWDLPKKMEGEFADKLWDDLMNVPFSNVPSAARTQAEFSQAVVELTVAEALAKRQALSADDVLGITHRTLQKTLADAPVPLSVEEYQSLLEDIASNTLTKFGLKPATSVPKPSAAAAVESVVPPKINAGIKDAEEELLELTTKRSLLNKKGSYEKFDDLLKSSPRTVDELRNAAKALDESGQLSADKFDELVDGIQRLRKAKRFSEETVQQALKMAAKSENPAEEIARLSRLSDDMLEAVSPVINSEAFQKAAETNGKVFSSFNRAVESAGKDAVYVYQNLLETPQAYEHITDLVRNTPGTISYQKVRGVVKEVNLHQGIFTRLKNIHQAETFGQMGGTQQLEGVLETLAGLANVSGSRAVQSQTAILGTLDAMQDLLKIAPSATNTRFEHFKGVWDQLGTEGYEIYINSLNVLRNKGGLLPKGILVQANKGGSPNLLRVATGTLDEAIEVVGTAELLKEGGYITITGVDKTSPTAAAFSGRKLKIEAVEAFGLKGTRGGARTSTQPVEVMGTSKQLQEGGNIKIAPMEPVKLQGTRDVATKRMPPTFEGDVVVWIEGKRYFIDWKNYQSGGTLKRSDIFKARKAINNPLKYEITKLDEGGHVVQFDPQAEIVNVDNVIFLSPESFSKSTNDLLNFDYRVNVPTGKSLMAGTANPAQGDDLMRLKDAIDVKKAEALKNKTQNAAE